MKSNFYITILVVFFLLLAAKIIISGAFLRTSLAGITAPDVAMAEEVDTEGDQSIEEIEMRLRIREKELSEKEAELKKMEAQLLPLKEEINIRMDELNDLQNNLTAISKSLAKRENALQDAKIDHLVKLYSSMEAGKAAAILDKLQLDIVVRILGNMKGKAAGEILAMMTPDKGATISKKLSETE